jgi:hypothetical protein
MGILIRSVHVGELLLEVSIRVIGKGGVPGTGFMGLGYMIPTRLILPNKLGGIPCGHRMSITDLHSAPLEANAL